MKYVINNCFGGFGVSIEILKQLIEHDCEFVEVVPIEEWSGTVDHPTEFEERFEVVLDDGWRANHWGSALYHEGFVYSLKNSDSLNFRSHPLLVQLVKEYGKKSNSPYSKLAIVEIPDGVEVELCEYDGAEHLAEKHRKWYGESVNE